MGDLTKNFSKSEFKCKCCGKVHMDEAFVGMLQEIRDEVGFPIRITSGYRCPKHNSRVSSTGRSGPHTTGMAADIAVHGVQAHAVLRAALKVGMSGIGVKQKGPHSSRFLHLDSLTTNPRPWVWSY